MMTAAMTSTQGHHVLVLAFVTERTSHDRSDDGGSLFVFPTDAFANVS